MAIAIIHYSIVKEKYHSERWNTGLETPEGILVNTGKDETIGLETPEVIVAITPENWVRL